LAADCQHSHPVAGFSALSRHSRNSAEEAQNCATKWWRFCLERAERRVPYAERGDLLPVFLSGPVLGVTLCGVGMVTGARLADGPVRRGT
jgi:hypothetical protein